MILTKIKDLFSKALIILSFFLFLSIFVYINYIASPNFKAPVLKSLALTLGFLLIFIAVDYFMDKFKNLGDNELIRLANSGDRAA